MLTCSIVGKCSNAMSKLGIELLTRVKSFVEALINMVCEMKITQGSKKIVLKFNGDQIFW